VLKRSHLSYFSRRYLRQVARRVSIIVVVVLNSLRNIAIHVAFGLFVGLGT